MEEQRPHIKVGNGGIVVRVEGPKMTMFNDETLSVPHDGDEYNLTVAAGTTRKLARME